MDLNLEFFTNDRYVVLKLLGEHQMQVKDAVYAKISQQELADLAHFSKLKVNKIIKELCEYGYVDTSASGNARYSLTEKGDKILSYIARKSI